MRYLRNSFAGATYSAFSRRPCAWIRFHWPRRLPVPCEPSRNHLLRHPDRQTAASGTAASFQPGALGLHSFAPVGPAALIATEVTVIVGRAVAFQQRLAATRSAANPRHRSNSVDVPTSPADIRRTARRATAARRPTLSESNLCNLAYLLPSPLLTKQEARPWGFLRKFWF